MNVIVVFYSRTGRTESRALRAAVGAVQSRANIRLRRLADCADEAAIAGVPEWSRNRERMNREYVAARPADAEWADVMVLGTPRGFGADCAEWRPFFALLRAAHKDAKLEGKVAAVFTPDDDGAAESLSLCSEMNGLGFVTVPGPAAATVEDARVLARRAVAVARAIKETR